MQLHTYIGWMATPNRSYLCYALAARKSARHLSRLYDNHLAPAGLSVSQFSILRLLKEHGRLKITQLAQLLIMERTSLVRALKPLQASGWVVAERSDNGRAFDVTRNCVITQLNVGPPIVADPMPSRCIHWFLFRRRRVGRVRWI